jgi:hypothetical protein
MYDDSPRFRYATDPCTAWQFAQLNPSALGSYVNSYPGGVAVDPSVCPAHASYPADEWLPTVPFSAPPDRVFAGTIPAFAPSTSGYAATALWHARHVSFVPALISSLLFGTPCCATG